MDFVELTAIPLLNKARIAAVSVGIVNKEPCLDLPYVEDSIAEVDMNIVMTDDGRFIEVQGTAEHAPFDRKELDVLCDLAGVGVKQLVTAQRAAVQAARP